MIPRWYFISVLPLLEDDSHLGKLDALLFTLDLETKSRYKLTLFRGINKPVPEPLTIASGCQAQGEL
jgi:hypothetical protein